MDIGDLNRFGFRIGPSTRSAEARNVSIFIHGINLCRCDPLAYLPSFLGGLRSQSSSLKKCLNFERYADQFRDLNVSQIHNAFLHRDPAIFTDDQDRLRVAAFHQFLALNEPNTDCFAAYLIPSCRGALCLTCQLAIDGSGRFEKLDVVDGVAEIWPYELIRTIDAAIDYLETSVQIGRR
jgi:hypothetical protein